MSRKRKNQSDQGLADVLGNWGVGFEVLRVLVNAILALGGTLDHLKRLLNEPKLVEQIAHLLVPTLVTEAVAKVATAVSAIFEAAVDYATPTFDALKAWFVGYINPDFQNAAFEPIPVCQAVSRKNGKIEFVLVHLARGASTEAVLAELDRLGYRPAIYEELIAFSKANPAMGIEYPVVALGSVALLGAGRRFVAFLDQHDGERALRLGWIDGGWDGIFRFLAVRKELPAAA